MITQTFFQGFFDADGSIQIYLKPNTGLNHVFKCYIIFNITQSQHNKHTLEVIQKTFGGNLIYKCRKTGLKEIIYRSYITSPSGQKISSFLNNHLPLNPSKRKDFLIAMHLYNLIKKKTTFKY